MPVKLENREKTLVAFVDGEIDHHTAKGIRETIDIAIVRDKPDKLVLDFSGITFMDSSGVGLIMGRYKMMCGKLKVTGAPPSTEKMLKLSGLLRLNVMEESKNG